jgi:hypothetical protein
MREGQRPALVPAVARRFIPKIGFENHKLRSSSSSSSSAVAEESAAEGGGRTDGAAVPSTDVNTDLCEV